MKYEDITSLSESANGLFSNVTFLREFVKNLPWLEFYRLYSEAKVDEGFLFDYQEITKDIVEGNDNGKKLAIALFGNIGWGLSFSRLDTNQIMQLAETSPAHKLALLSNVRLDWYAARGYGLDSIIRRKLLAPIILNENKENHGYIYALLKNPRMDRRFIADVVRGKDEFNCIPLKTRLWYGIWATKVKGIKSCYYPGQDSPGDNELYFNQPAKALLAIIKEVVDTDTEIPMEEGFWEDIIAYYANNHLDIDNKDWVSAEELQKAESLVFMKSLKFLHSSATQNILEWASNVGGKEPLSIEMDEKEKHNPYRMFKAYAKGTFATVIVYKILNDDYQIEKQEKNERIEKYLASGNWCIRAGAYAAKYDTGLPYSNEQAITYTKQFLEGHTQDIQALLRGIVLSRQFWKTYKEAWHTNSYVEFKQVLMEGGVSNHKDTTCFCEHWRELIFPEYGEEHEEGSNVDTLSFTQNPLLEPQETAFSGNNAALLNNLHQNTMILKKWVGIATILVMIIFVKLVF